MVGKLKFAVLPDRAAYRPTRGEIWKELVAVVDLSSFVFISAVLYFLMFPISLVFLGRLGTVYLDAVGLGNTVFNVFGILVFNGMLTGADTTMSQSYGTANKKVVSVFFQKGVLMYSLVVMVCIAIMVNTETMLVLIGQDREIARLAGDYVTILAPGIAGYGTWALTTRFFRVQNVIWVSFVSLLFVVATSVLGHYLAISVWQYGLEASAYVQVLAYWLGAIAMLIIMPLQRNVINRTWTSFSYECLQEWKTYFSLSFSGLLVICCQWWGLEICTLLSGNLGHLELGAQAIVFQLNYFIYIFPISIGISCNILIGQHVGAGEPEAGKLCMKIGWALTWTLSLIAIITIVLLRRVIPTIFSADEDVIALTSDTIPYLALYHAFDSTVSSSLGMCRGVARQKMGSCVSFLGIYIIGLPIGIYLTFYEKMGLKGLWLGPAIGLAVEAILLLGLLSRTDWPAECRAAQIRAGLDPAQVDSETRSRYYESDDEGSSLLSDRVRQQTKRFAPEYASSQTDLSAIKSLPEHRLPPEQLLLRRGFAFFICTLILVGGIFLHFNLKLDYDWIDLCIVRSNATNSTTFNSTLPYCI